MNKLHAPRLAPAVIAAVLLAMLARQASAAPPEDPMKGIHVSARVTPAAIMRTSLTYDVTVYLRLTYTHAGLPTKVEVVGSSKIPLVDECAVLNTQRFWSLDGAQHVPTVRVVPLRLRRIPARFMA